MEEGRGRHGQPGLAEQTRDQNVVKVFVHIKSSKCLVHRSAKEQRLHYAEQKLQQASASRKYSMDKVRQLSQEYSLLCFALF